MQRRLIYSLTVLSLTACPLFSQMKEARPAWVSTLKCLAPLAREAREGSAPLTMEQAFFDGPFSFPATSTKSSSEPQQDKLRAGFSKLIEFDDREADRYFRDAMLQTGTAGAALLGLAQSNADSLRRAKCFLDEAQNSMGEDAVVSQWDEYLSASILEKPGSHSTDFIEKWIDLAIESGRAEIALSAARFLIVSATAGKPFDKTITYLNQLASVSPELHGLPLLHAPETADELVVGAPQWYRLAAEQALAKKDLNRAIEQLTQALRSEHARLSTTGNVMPESTLGLGTTASQLMQLLDQQGDHEAVAVIAHSLLNLPRDIFSVGKRWRRLDRDSTAWVTGRHALAHQMIKLKHWDKLATLPRGFSSRDKSEWFLWQIIAAQETGSDPNLWLAALRREREGSDLLAGAENYLHWRIEGELFEPLQLPGVPIDLTEPTVASESTSTATQILTDLISRISRQAPMFSLPNWKEELISLEDYHGKPVLVIFFLGGGCLHCVEQLTAFGPWASKFEEAGIPILAVSTDPVEILSETLSGEEKIETSFPIPIVSDHQLDAFKEWGTYDDFDQRAIHGTFLLNASSEIIWRENGNAPYMHPDFLLHESQRLLQEP
ncbi:MAG: redoxin domain-containing protein, partial [Verrucomicrobiota bacterium]